ncbi:MAG: sigma-70 family RNA polymerase sigma factor [Verrucomicrobiales bacterium]|nr:sigma-70 family RNA polymerase sigma factor [Verrucomicrobiales bacterium]MCP5559605.1 sigma-70 family RNA polymerase sigma factor [Verrucomicrobiaceae bacterium]
MTSSFHDTRWTLISRSRGDDAGARVALSELCAAYYEPVVMFLRHDGRMADEARSLAHDFFAKLLGGDAIGGADPTKGKFRSYLLAAVKRFAADQRERCNAAKRGGGQSHVIIDQGESATGAGLQIEDDHIEPPDAAFDRQWALTLLALALARLESEMTAIGKAVQFTTLKPWLTAETDGISQSTAATQLGISEEAVKVAIHRLRRRFREAVKTEIAQTVSDPERVHDELEALKAALRQ